MAEMSGGAKMHTYEEYVNPVLGKRLRQLNMDKVFVQGIGADLIDQTGQKYLDFIASYGALPFGFNHPEIWAALNQIYIKKEPSLIQPSYLEAAGELAKELVALSPTGIRYVTFANSGAEAVEAALKMARMYTRKNGIITTENSFHGKTLGALSATGKDLYQKGSGAPAPGFKRISYGDLDALRNELANKPDFYAAFIVEPIQGEGGIIIPPAGYLHEVRAICDQYQVLLIVDEIQTGLGRTGKMFACEDEKITPDIITIAKALGGGIIPIGACLATEKVYTEDFALKHSSTFAANTIACRVGLAVLDLLTRDNCHLVREVKEKGDYLLERLKIIYQKYKPIIADVRGRGLMLGLELGVNSDQLPGSFLGILGDQEFLSPVVSSYLLNVEHLRVAPTLNGAAVIRLEPPLTITEEQCCQAMNSIDRMAENLSYGNSASFFGHLADFYPQNIVTNRVIAKNPVRPSGNPNEGRFAFLIHPLYVKNYCEFDQSLKIFTEEQLEKLTGRWNDLIEPFVISKARIISPTGAEAYGEFISIARTSEELTSLPREQVLAELTAAVNLAKERGAKIVGLGAYTSVVTKGGRDIRDLGVALTTGNSYTVAVAVEAMIEAAKQLSISINKSIAAVVGATGSIGRALAILLSEQVDSLVLIGNPNRAEHSRRRLMRVCAEIYQYLNLKGNQVQGTIACFVQNHPQAPAKEASLEEYQEFAQLVAEESPLIYSVDLEHYLPQADLVLTATSQVNSLITPELLKFGAVVCDVARPADVSIEVKSARPDVLVIDGGVVAVPNYPDLGWNFGFERGLAYACMSETMMLALEQEYQHFSLGIDINLETINYFRMLAAKHQFKLAGFRSFDRPLESEAWEAVLRARMKELACG